MQYKDGVKNVSKKETNWDVTFSRNWINMFILVEKPSNSFVILKIILKSNQNEKKEFESFQLKSLPCSFKMSVFGKYSTRNNIMINI